MMADARRKALFSLASESHKSYFTRSLVYSHSLLVTGVFYWLPVAVLYVTTRVKSIPKKLALFLAALLAVFVPVKRWDAFAKSSYWDEMLKYFRVQVVGVPPPLRHEANSIVYGVAPHGIVPFSLGLMQYGSLGEFFDAPRITTATVVKYIPVFSHMLYLGGAVEATKSEMAKVLSAGGGAAVAVTPGGIAEMFLGATATEEFALLNDRKGFVRVALEHGSTLVPVFCFGASQLFARVAMPQAVEDLSRMLRASILLFFGKCGLPIPFEAPMTYALGEHIRLPVTPNPSPECVDWVHNVFKSALVRAFESGKGDTNFDAKRLVVM
jgi:2-acylglycerol O-acyltransferase 2